MKDVGRNKAWGHQYSRRGANEVNYFLDRRNLLLNFRWESAKKSDRESAVTLEDKSLSNILLMTNARPEVAEHLFSEES